MQGLKNLLSKLDQTSVPISRTKTYSSNVGKCFGIIFVILLTLAFVFKLIAMVNKDTIYLNSYYANDRSPVSINDYQFRLTLGDWDDLITFDNQEEFGLKITMTQTIRTLKNITQVQNDSILYQIDERIQEKDMMSLKLSQLQISTYTESVRAFDMIDCPTNGGFCTPKQFTSNLTLEGDAYFQDKRIVEYKINVKPCSKYNPKCKSVSPFGYLSLYTFRCKKFDIYESDTEKMVDSCQAMTGRIDLIADAKYNQSITFTYFFKQVNITTFQPSFVPSFIPTFLRPNSKKQNFQQFWYYDEQSTQTASKRSSESESYYQVNFRRSRKSESYERRFIGIDNVLAQVFGISSFVALVLKIIFGNYAEWEAECFIAQKVTRDANYRGSFFKYVKEKLKCCLSADQKVRIASRYKALQKANQNVDIIDASYKIMELEQKIKIYEEIIAFQLKGESEDKKRQVLQLLQKRKTESIILNFEQKNKSEGNLMKYQRHSLNQSLIQSESKVNSNDL